MNTEENFVLASLKEFVRLWGSGCQSSFQLQCKNKQAWFKLESVLGSPASPHFVPHTLSNDHPPQPRRRKGPGRQQKDRDRAAAHRAKLASADPSTSSSSTESVESSTPNPLPTATAVSAVSTTATISSISTACSMSSPETVVSTSTSSIASLAVPASMSHSTPSAAPVAVVPPPPEASEAEAASVEDELCPDSEYIKGVEDNAVVHATAEFENSPFQQLVQEDLASLEKFLSSEDHLRNNIMKVEFEVTAKWKVNVRLHVKRTNLWEGPRSYIWKFLGGQNFWDRQNGTKIRLVRIHEK